MASDSEFVPQLRLHPLSWVFVLVASLRQFIVPIVAALLFGARDDGSMWGLIVVVPLVIAAVWRQFLFRYGFGPRGLVIRDGLLFRNVRQIEYERIENIDTERGILHRLMNVAEARIETSAGGKPEALIRVLSLDAVRELREHIFDRTGPRSPQETLQPAAQSTEELLRLPLAELVRYGVVDNRGMLIVAAVFGAIAQSEDYAKLAMRFIPRDLIERNLATLGVSLIAVGLGVLLVLFLFVRLLSVVWALVTLYDFTLVRSGGDLRMRYGLLTRIALTLRLPRIQAVHQNESLLHRFFGRVSLEVDLAGDSGQQSDEGGAGRHRVRWLAPICTPARASELLRIALPNLARDAAPDWQPLAPKANGRLLRKGILVLTLVAAWPGIYFFGGAAPALWLVIVPLAWLHATLYVRYTRWALTHEALYFRSGWLTRRLSIVPRDRVQTARWAASPFDRRARMAGVMVDTAGAGGLIRIRYLPEAIAAELLRKLYISTSGGVSQRGTVLTNVSS